MRHFGNSFPNAAGTMEVPPPMVTAPAESTMNSVVPLRSPSNMLPAVVEPKVVHTGGLGGGARVAFDAPARVARP
jgi:hypothetical protein